jgi:hypothetical protein
MITIEVREAKKASEGLTEVEMFCDPDGLAELLKQLGHLKAGSSHVHLMTPAWAGNELGEKTFGAGTTIINHLRITMLPATALK